ncbi:unnamed protein product [Staurois parvus]|uniref:Uncharacterized protein n=1 Tax=Staurois parvus TaxID=386267 RepID=A0ABN9AF49_9NEOB|nr:unnamed protein product [Staurois parvus]
MWYYAADMWIQARGLLPVAFASKAVVVYTPVYKRRSAISSITELSTVIHTLYMRMAQLQPSEL